MGFFWDVKKVIGAQIEPGLVQVMEGGREVLAGAAGERSRYEKDGLTKKN